MTRNWSEKMRPVVHNNALVHRIVMDGGDLEDVIVALHELNERYFKRIIELETIAPRRFTMPDGTVMVWHCPDKLIPETHHELKSHE